MKELNYTVLPDSALFMDNANAPVPAPVGCTRQHRDHLPHLIPEFVTKRHNRKGLVFISLTFGSSSSSLLGLCVQEKPAQCLPTAAISKRETEMELAFLRFLTRQLLICLHKTDTALIRLVCACRWVKKESNNRDNGRCRLSCLELSSSESCAGNIRHLMTNSST